VPVHAQERHTPICSQSGLMPTVYAAAPISCAQSSHRPGGPAPQKTLKLPFSFKKKLKASKGFQFVSLRPENHIFCFKVPEMPLKAHASSAVSVGAKNRSCHNTDP
jgi:hypothetical protein